MAQQVCVVLSAVEREQLAAIAADHNRLCTHFERARIVLVSTDRNSAQQWRKASASAGRRCGVAIALCRERGRRSVARQTRKAGKMPLGVETTAQVVAETCTEPPHQATH
jgi:hypothetical protein